MPVTVEGRVAVTPGSLGSGAIGALFRYALALTYAFALCYAYEVLSRWWAYFGFSYRLDDDTLRVAACFVSALPAALLEGRPRNFAQAAAWFLYALVFLPCLLVPVMQYAEGTSRLTSVFCSTLLGCVIFLMLVRGEIRRVTLPNVSSRLFWSILATVWVAMLLLIAVSFGGSFQFVGADDIYSQRALGSEVASNPLVRYSIALLASAIDPFLIAFGLYTRRYWISAAGVVAQVFLFGTLAARSVLLSPLFVIGAYLMGNGRKEMRGNLLLIGLVGVFALTSPLLTRYDPLGAGLDQLTTLLYMRTLLIAGATYGVYVQFFSQYPITFFSNNNLVSIFISYPYGDLSVGQAVLTMLIPISGPDIPELNASFVATDGIAALNLPGVPLASVALALVLRFLSRFVPENRTMLMVAGSIGFILSLSNTSLLTSLVTGGGVLLTALVCLVPVKRD